MSTRSLLIHYELTLKVRQNKIVLVTSESVSAAAIAQHLAAEGIFCSKVCNICQGYFGNRVGCDDGVDYMTDNRMLFDMRVSGFNLYSVIVMDASQHQRTMLRVITFALLKQLVQPDGSRLVIKCANGDADEVSSYLKDFKGRNICRITGEISYEVEIIYLKKRHNYISAASDMVLKIHLAEDEGDILLFLAGEDDIDVAFHSISKRVEVSSDDTRQLTISRIYNGCLPPEMQSLGFDTGGRRVVLATDSSLASITIPSVVYVIDPGVVGKTQYNPVQGLEVVGIETISKRMAENRCRRAGLKGPGKCFRLYESVHHNAMLPSAVPHIKRSNPVYTLLTLKVVGIDPLADFIDAPPHQAVMSSVELLKDLGALDEEEQLTDLGRKMAKFPLDPPLSRMLISSVENGCSDEMVTIIALIKTGDLWRIGGEQGEADHFLHRGGGLETLMVVCKAWEAWKLSAQWCSENFVSPQAFRRAQDLRKHIINIMEECRLLVISGGNGFTKIGRAITAGFWIPRGI